VKIPYDQIPLVPTIVAETVARQPLQGLPKLEKKRRRMTAEEVREFADLCEARLRASYANGGVMLEIARLPGDQGRDELAYWVRFLLTLYLRDPQIMRRWKENH
jgi:hypothetical protein